MSSPWWLGGAWWEEDANKAPAKAPQAASVDSDAKPSSSPPAKKAPADGAEDAASMRVGWAGSKVSGGGVSNKAGTHVSTAQFNEPELTKEDCDKSNVASSINPFPEVFPNEIMAPGRSSTGTGADDAPTSYNGMTPGQKLAGWEAYNREMLDVQSKAQAIIDEREKKEQAERQQQRQAKVAAWEEKEGKPSTAAAPKPAPKKVSFAAAGDGGDEATEKEFEAPDSDDAPDMVAWNDVVSLSGKIATTTATTTTATTTSSSSSHGHSHGGRPCQGHGHGHGHGHSHGGRPCQGHGHGHGHSHGHSHSHSHSHSHNHSHAPRPGSYGEEDSSSDEYSPNSKEQLLDLSLLEEDGSEFDDETLMSLPFDAILAAHERLGAAFELCDDDLQREIRQMWALRNADALRKLIGATAEGADCEVSVSQAEDDDDSLPDGVNADAAKPEALPGFDIRAAAAAADNDDDEELPPGATAAETFDGVARGCNDSDDDAPPPTEGARGSPEVFDLQPAEAAAAAAAAAADEQQQSESSEGGEEDSVEARTRRGDGRRKTLKKKLTTPAPPTSASAAARMESESPSPVREQAGEKAAAAAAATAAASGDGQTPDVVPDLAGATPAQGEKAPLKARVPGIGYFRKGAVVGTYHLDDKSLRDFCHKWKMNCYSTDLQKGIGKTGIVTSTHPSGCVSVIFKGEMGLKLKFPPTAFKLFCGPVRGPVTSSDEELKTAHTIIDALRSPKGCISMENFLPDEEAEACCDAAWGLCEDKDEMRQGGTGGHGGASVARDGVLRGDQIRFIPRQASLDGYDSTLPEGLDLLLTRLHRLRKAIAFLLDKALYRTSIQLAKYPGEGKGYVRHRDVKLALKEPERRRITVTYYCNKEWKDEYGGYAETPLLLFLPCCFLAHTHRTHVCTICSHTTGTSLSTPALATPSSIRGPGTRLPKRRGRRRRCSRRGCTCGPRRTPWPSSSRTCSTRCCR